MKYEIDGAIAEVAALVPEATPALPLTPAAQTLLGVSTVESRQEALKLLLDLHAREGRLTVSGASVKLLPQAAELLKLPVDRQVAWDSVWKRISRLFH
jgi:hypothetical protein